MKSDPRPSTLLLVLFLATALAVEPLDAARGKKKNLPERHRQWLEDVELLLPSRTEKAFLRLGSDAERDAFIGEFWAVRDPDPQLGSNLFKETWYRRLEIAKREYGNSRDRRFGVYLFNAEPDQELETDCGELTWPLVIWRYGFSEHMLRSLTVLFYQQHGAGSYKLWAPREGYNVLLQNAVYEERDLDREHSSRWEVGRGLSQEKPELALRAMDGELPVVGWKGGVEKKLKKQEKYGSLFYLALWQGLRGDDLDIDLSQETQLVCSRTGMKVIYTPDVSKYSSVDDEG